MIIHVVVTSHQDGRIEAFMGSKVGAVEREERKEAAGAMQVWSEHKAVGT